MANHAGSWASGALVRFSSLNFIITLDGGLERIQAPACPSGIDAAGVHGVARRYLLALVPRRIPQS